MKLFKNKKIQYAVLSIWVFFIFFFALFCKMANKYNPNKDNALLNECKMIITNVEAYDATYVGTSNFDTLIESLKDNVSALDALATSEEENKGQYDYYMTICNLRDSVQLAIDKEFTENSLINAYNGATRIITAYNVFNVIWVICLIVGSLNFVFWGVLFVGEWVLNKKNKNVIINNN